jgi:hypothetical protein
VARPITYAVDMDCSLNCRIFLPFQSPAGNMEGRNIYPTVLGLQPLYAFGTAQLVCARQQNWPGLPPSELDTDLPV